MALHKTERARTALQTHATDLSLAERRVLILCDGQRGRHDLAALLGPGAPAWIDGLLRQGYLSLEGPGTATPGTPIATDVVATAPPPRTPSRRSLAASKMYLLDMLQLQRDPESASLRAEIQTSPSEDELAYRMMKALRHLQSVATASYARRVGERLAEILPDPYLPRLEEVRASWLASIPAVA